MSDSAPTQSNASTAHIVALVKFWAVATVIGAWLGAIVWLLSR